MVRMQIMIQCNNSNNAEGKAHKVEAGDHGDEKQHFL